MLGWGSAGRRHPCQGTRDRGPLAFASCWLPVQKVPNPGIADPPSPTSYGLPRMECEGHCPTHAAVKWAPRQGGVCLARDPLLGHTLGEKLVSEDRWPLLGEDRGLLLHFRQETKGA